MSMDVGLEMAPKGGPCLSVMGTYEHYHYIPDFLSIVSFIRDGRHYTLTFNTGEQFTIVDWTKPDQPFRVDSDYVSPVALSTGNSAIRVSDDTNYLYAMDPAETLVPGTTADFYVFDISDFGNIQLIGSMTNNLFSAFEFRPITDNTFFSQRVGFTPGAVVTIDASNPAAPVIADTFSTTTMNVLTFRPLTGGVYGASLNQVLNRLEIYDLNNIYDIQQIFAGLGTVTASITTRIIGSLDNYLYIYKSQTLTLYVVDVSNPSNPTIANSIVGSIPSSWIDLDTESDLFLSSGPGVIKAMYLDDPLNPVIEDFVVSVEDFDALEFLYMPGDGDTPADSNDDFGIFATHPQGKWVGFKHTTREGMLGSIDVSCITNSGRPRWRQHSLPNQPNTHINDAVPTLGEPIVYWDTRTHTHTDDGFLVNLGSGGDVWDLPIDQFTPGNPNDGYWAHKRRDWFTPPNPNPPTIGDNFPVGWEDLGGDVCQSPVTWIVAIPEYPTDAEADLWGGQQNTEVYLDSNATGFTTIGHNFELVMNSYDDEPHYDGFAGQYGRTLGVVENDGTFMEWYPGDELDRGNPISSTRDILYVSTIDFRRQTADLWIVDASGEYHAIEGGPGEQGFDFEYFFLEYPGNPYCEYDSWGATFGRLFLGIGYHNGAPRSVGESWSNVTAFIYARGKPTEDQRRNWFNEFF